MPAVEAHQQRVGPCRLLADPGPGAAGRELRTVHAGKVPKVGGSVGISGYGLLPDASLTARFVATGKADGGRWTPTGMQGLAAP